MLFRCRECAQLYAAQVEPADGLCLVCRGKRGAGVPQEEGLHDAADWRKPLYDYACSLVSRRRPEEWARLEEVLIRLGDYRDCAHMLEKMRLHMQNVCALAMEDVKTSERRVVLETAVAHLRALNADAQTLAAGEEKLRRIIEREERERREVLRRSYLRAKRRFALGLFAGAALAVWLLAYIMVIFPGRLNRAEELIAQGQSEEAVNLCLESEKIWETKRGSELLLAARTALAHDLLGEGRFEEAAVLYRQLDMEPELEETYDRWSSALAAQGETKAAIGILLRMKGNDVREERLPALYMTRAGEAAEEAIARGVQDVAYAREQGEAIPNLDAQLRYCHALFEAGFDLAAVYPDGVEITDAKLARFQIDGAQAQEAELPLEHALVFSRTENGGSVIPWLTYSLNKTTSHDRTQDSLYRVRLLPGHMFREGAQPARSFAEAETVLLMDGVYIREGMIFVWGNLQIPGLPRRFVRTGYPYFSAVSSVAAYDLRDPRRMQVFAKEIDMPLCSDETWMQTYGEDEAAASGLSARLGDLNMDGMRAELDRLLFGVDPGEGGRETEGAQKEGDKDDGSP